MAILGHPQNADHQMKEGGRKLHTREALRKSHWCDKWFTLKDYHFIFYFLPTNKIFSLDNTQGTETFLNPVVSTWTSAISSSSTYQRTFSNSTPKLQSPGSVICDMFQVFAKIHNQMCLRHQKCLMNQNFHSLLWNVWESQI